MITLRNLNLIGDVEIRAKSASGPVAFEVVAYTGGKLRLQNFQHPLVVDLAQLRLGRSLVANLDHDPQQRVGIVNHVDNNGRRLLLSGTLSAATRHRDEVLASHKNGFRWQASIECNVESLSDLATGRQSHVNGRMVAGPAQIAAAELKGFAFVSHGADDETEVSIAASCAFRPRADGPQVFTARAINDITRWVS